MWKYFIVVSVLLFSLNVRVARAGNEIAPECIGADDVELQNFVLSSLVLRSTQLRTVGILAPEKIPELFAVSDHAFPDLRLFTTADIAASSALWAYFFRGTQVYFARTNSSQPIVAYYNAILDYWWLSEWVLIQENFKLVRSYLWTSHPVLGRDDSLAVWLRQIRQDGLLGSVAKQVQRNIQQFQVEHPYASCVVNAHTLTEEARQAHRLSFARYAGTALSSYSDFLLRTSFADEQQHLYDYLAAQQNTVPAGLDLSALSSEVLNAAFQMPQAFRLGLTPVFVLDLEQVVYVISASPNQGRYFFVNKLSAQGHRTSVESLGLLDAYYEVQQ